MTPAQQSDGRIHIRMGGYGPATTSFSRSLKRIGERLEAQFGDRIAVHYVWNIMDLGYRSEDILWLVESGILTLGYQSSSYLTDRVPELNVPDLPFLFRSNEQARAAMDGDFGRYLAGAIEREMNYRILGWFENGFRHLSNRLRDVRTPADLAGMSIRVLPSDVHVRTFELLGAVALRMDLTEAIERMVKGTIDAQENPLSNSVTYGAHKVHPYFTLSGHFYVSRPIFLCRSAFEAWPPDLQEAMRAAVHEAVAFQRGETVRENAEARAAIAAQGSHIVELNEAEHESFVRAVQPVVDDARKRYAPELIRLAGL